MENNKFFILINRTNSILFFAVLVAILALLVYVVSEFDRSRGARSVEIDSLGKASEEKEVIELSQVEPVYGHDYQMIRVYSRKDGVLASGGYTRTLRNILFLDPRGANPRWLLETNDQVITEIWQLRHEEGKGDEITDYCYFAVVTADTNKDGQLSSKDKTTILISDPAGTDVSVLATDLDQILNSQYDDGSRTLSILARVGNRLLYRTYSLAPLQLLDEKFVVDVE